MYKGFWMIRLHPIGRSAVHQKDIHHLDSRCECACFWSVGRNRHGLRRTRKDQIQLRTFRQWSYRSYHRNAKIKIRINSAIFTNNAIGWFSMKTIRFLFFWICIVYFSPSLSLTASPPPSLFYTEPFKADDHLSVWTSPHEAMPYISKSMLDLIDQC